MPNSKSEEKSEGDAKSISELRNDIRQKTRSMLELILKGVKHSLESGKLTSRESKYASQLTDMIIENGFLHGPWDGLLSKDELVNQNKDNKEDQSSMLKFYDELNDTDEYAFWSNAYQFLAIGYIGGVLNEKPALLETFIKGTKERAKAQTENARKARWKDSMEVIKLKREICMKCALEYLEKNSTNTISMYGLVTSILPDVQKKCKSIGIYSITHSSVTGYLKQDGLSHSKLRQ